MYISPTLEGQFRQIQGSWLTLFLLETLTVSAPCLLAARVSGEKPAGDFIEDPRGRCCSGLWTLSVFCLRLWPLEVWLSCVWCGSLGFILCGVLCTSWIFTFTYLRLHCLFSHLESFSRYFFTLLGPFLCPPGTCVLWGCMCAWWSRGSFRLITFLQSCLSAPQSRSSSLSCFRFFVFFLPAQICLFSNKFSNEFFISVTVLFGSRISSWLLFRFRISSLIFSHIIFFLFIFL